MERAYLESVQKLAEALAALEDVDKMADLALQTAVDALDVRHAAVSTRSGTGTCLIRAWRGISAMFRATAAVYNPWPIADSQPRPVLAGNLAEAPDALRDALEDEGLQALACFPLLAQGEVLGAFTLYREQPLPFPQEQALLGRTIAAVLALAVAPHLE